MAYRAPNPAPLLVLVWLSACTVTGAAPPASQQTTGINAQGGPGSNAP